MIHRQMCEKLIAIAQQYWVVAIIGPRQSGKTTLVQNAFPTHRYISFEDLDVREFATKDPRGFLANIHNEFGVILDEIQHVPTLLSYIQTYVDREKKPGYFILTGSQNFLVNQAITQTLAGRIALLTLLPFSVKELRDASLTPDSIEDVLFKGFYPSLYADITKDISYWYDNYIKTYIERDVRLITNITNLTALKTFMQLCAGRTGQLLNLTSLANDCAISPNTAKAWLSVLEASYIIFLLRPHHSNFNKRLIKAPKLYFYDTGLACALLNIENSTQLVMHYLRGALVESLVIADIYKNFYNTAHSPHIYFWRDMQGHEIDCLIDKGTALLAIEIKSGKTIQSNFFDGLSFWHELSKQDLSHNYLVYAGAENQKRTIAHVLGWQSIDKIK